MSFQTFLQDRKTINAVLRSLEVLGEAAKRVPDDLRAKTPAVPWKRMAGMRDKLIHEYFGVDYSIVWTVVTSELPPPTARNRTPLARTRMIPGGGGQEAANHQVFCNQPLSRCAFLVDDADAKN